MHPVRVSRRVALKAGCAWLCLAGFTEAEEKKITRYVRFQKDDLVAYGAIEGEEVRQLEGDTFGFWRRTDKVHALKSVRLLAPSQPTQVLALAGNYRSHLKDEVIPEKFKIPQAFFKTPSCIVPNGANIVLPKGSKDVHYEGELVLVIGKKAKDVPPAQALEYVLGVTCGNDVSARNWQKDDVQWWRAKGTDTFGPCGPMIVSGIDYDDLLLQTRVNGEVKQKQRTKDLIHDCKTMVSYLSRHVTLLPGDLIYTGTPGKTSALKDGDVVEVEIEGIGILRNKVST
jgi:2-keto-4-pentenoate hydratase/2-oxohepta-3-ene-1,7-dioic acid hydratase in catechol pathway